VNEQPSISDQHFEVTDRDTVKSFVVANQAPRYTIPAKMSGGATIT
jgi:hypothetical protein